MPISTISIICIGLGVCSSIQVLILMNWQTRAMSVPSVKVLWNFSLGYQFICMYQSVFVFVEKGVFFRVMMTTLVFYPLFMYWSYHLCRIIIIPMHALFPELKESLHQNLIRLHVTFAILLSSLQINGMGLLYLNYGTLFNTNMVIVHFVLLAHFATLVTSLNYYLNRVLEMTDEHPLHQEYVRLVRKRINIGGIPQIFGAGIVPVVYLLYGSVPYAGIISAYLLVCNSIFVMVPIFALMPKVEKSPESESTSREETSTAFNAHQVRHRKRNKGAKHSGDTTHD